MMSLSAIFGGKFAYQFGNLTGIRLRTKLSVFLALYIL